MELRRSVRNYVAVFCLQEQNAVQGIFAFLRSFPMGKKNDSSTSSTPRGGKASKHSRESAKSATRVNRGRHQYQPTFDDRRPESAVDDVDAGEEDEASDGQSISSEFTAHLVLNIS